MPSSEPNPNDIPAMRNKSFDCPFCSGEGMTVIFHKHYDGRPAQEYQRPDGTTAQRPMRLSAYCSCPAGDAISRNHELHSPDVFKRIPHLNVVATKPDCDWSPDDPTLVDLHREPTWNEFKAEMARKPMLQTKPGPPKREPIRKTPKLPEPPRAMPIPSPEMPRHDVDDSEPPF